MLTSSKLPLVWSTFYVLFQFKEVNIWAPSLQCHFGHMFHLTLLLNRPYRKFAAAHSLLRNCTKLKSKNNTRGRYEKEFVGRLKSLWIEASLMRIYYSKHVSGALKFVWNFLQEGKELEPFHIIFILKSINEDVHSTRSCLYSLLCLVFQCLILCSWCPFASLALAVKSVFKRGGGGGVVRFWSWVLQSRSYLFSKEYKCYFINFMV